METTFITAAIEERRLLTEYVTNINPEIKIIRFTKVDGYDAYDAVAWSGGTLILIEVKVRDIAHDKYSAAILETVKIDNLQLQKNEMMELWGINVELIYVAFYNDGVAAEFNISNQCGVDWYYLPRTTVDSSRTNKVKTLCCEYCFNDAININEYEN